MNRNILNMKPSGIRRFTALARATPGCKMLTIGEPDFDTPAPSGLRRHRPWLTA